jgi:hypothetical protein
MEVICQVCLETMAQAKCLVFFKQSTGNIIIALFRLPVRVLLKGVDEMVKTIKPARINGTSMFSSDL